MVEAGVVDGSQALLYSCLQLRIANLVPELKEQEDASMSQRRADRSAISLWAEAFWCVLRVGPSVIRGLRADRKKLAGLAWGCVLSVSVLTLISACSLRQPSGGPVKERSFVVLAVNDVYRIEGVDEKQSGGLARLRTLRAELERLDPDLLVLHAGDLLFPSLLSRQYDGAQMIDVMNRLDGDDQAFDPRLFVTFGNHEFDLAKMRHAERLDENIKGSQFRWLGTNVSFALDEHGKPLVAADHLVDRVLVESGGVRVGIFSLTTDSKKPEYVKEFGDPIGVARQATASLREEGAEVVIGLTHLDRDDDIELLRRLGDDGPDVIFGGHEHQRQSAEVVGRWMLKADAEARSATVARITPRAEGPPEIAFEFRELDSKTAMDPAIAARADEWLIRHDQDYCADLNLAPSCLGEVLGHTRVRLIGEELAIRQVETNLGNWIVDQARRALEPYGAQVAFINSGSLRLNQDVAADSELTLRHVGEIFAYLSPLRLVRLDGATLRRVIARAAESCGSGAWLQVSGMAFRYDPRTRSASSITLLTADGPRAIAPDEEILAVTSDYLVNPANGQDGYDKVLGLHQRVPYPGEPFELQDLVIAGWKAAGEEGIAPQVEGRICDPSSPGPCLAVP